MSGIRHLVAVSSLLFSLSVSAESYFIDDIEFRGNEKTLPATMLQELRFGLKMKVSDKDIEQGRQAIMDLGLFKRVSADLEARDSQRKVLIYTVSEKHYLLVLPRLSRSGDGDWSYGARLRWDNVGGRNRRIDLGYRRKDLKSSDIQQEDQVRLRYILPRLWGSAFDLGFDLRSEDIEIDEERDELSGRYNQQLDSMRINLSRWLREKGPSQGWLAQTQIRYEDYENEHLSGDTGLFFDTRVMTLSFAIEYQKIHDLLYSRSGRNYGYRIEGASDAWGSESSFVRHHLWYRRYKHITSTPHTNLNYQIRYSTSSGSVFGDPSFSLGGNSTMRGYNRESMEGESFFIANIEVLRPLFGHNTLRGTLFTDIGGAFEDSADFDTSEIEIALGFGIRYKLRSFVKTDLRLDFAWGANGEFKVYGATDTPF